MNTQEPWKKEFFEALVIKLSKEKPPTGLDLFLKMVGIK
jgi:hypothetical protein